MAQADEQKAQRLGEVLEQLATVCKFAKQLYIAENDWPAFNKACKTFGKLALKYFYNDFRWVLKFHTVVCHYPEVAQSWGGIGFGSEQSLEGAIGIMKKEMRSLRYMRPNPRL